jgi:hypothetical protein
LISWTHKGPLGAFAASLQSCGLIHFGGDIWRM